MNSKYFATMLLISFFLNSSVILAKDVNNESIVDYSSDKSSNVLSNNYEKNLRGQVSLVPVGTTFKVTTLEPISSESAYLGQTVKFLLNSDFYYDNMLISPAGSNVIGTVIKVSKAKRAGVNGKIAVRFTQINSPDGIQLPITAFLKTEDNSGVLYGSSKLDVTKDYAKDIAIGSAAGALSGVVFGALSGGKVGRGAALGTAVGAGGGLVKSVIDKGDNVFIQENALLDIVLTQPIIISNFNNSYKN